MDTGATYDCVNLTFPCVDIRGWIIDDNNGYHGSNGIAGVVIDFQMTPFGLVFLLGLLLPYTTEQTQTLLCLQTIYLCPMGIAAWLFQ